jgi:hypothetical protein
MRHMNGLLVDVETIPDDRAFDWVEPAGNLVDPAKKAASVREKQDKLSTDPNGCRIVAVGIWRLEHGEWTAAPSVDVATTEDGERRMLSSWLDRGEDPDTRIFGFCARTFDAPVLMRRAQILRVDFPRWNLARYGRGDVLDLFDEVTWHEGHHAGGVLSKSLDSYARIFGLPEVDDHGDGSMVGRWFKDGRMDLIAQHCTSDLYREAHLGYRLGLWPEPPMPVRVEQPEAAEPAGLRLVGA